MPLRATKPDATSKKLKLLLFSPAGVGKTTACIQFPKPYILDCIEHGTDHYADQINAAGGQVYHCPDINEAITETRALAAEPHDFQSLIYDAFTNLYQKEADRCEKTVGTEYQKHLLEANKPTRRLFDLAFKLDMNLVVTCHAKGLWEDNKVQGLTYDAWKKLDYVFDLALELHADMRRKNPPRIATVRKTRFKAFPLGESFEFSFQEIARRYPLAASERKAAATAFATADQVKRLHDLLAAVKVEDGTLDKWLAKAGVSHIDDLPTDTIQKCIDHLAAKLLGAPTT